MKLTAKLTALTLCMGLAGQALATELKHWPADQARQLDAMIAANANKGNFAVFDMDNTSPQTWKKRCCRLWKTAA